MFIGRDPIGLLGGVNVFAYAPNPIHWVDVLGLAKKKDKKTPAKDCCKEDPCGSNNKPWKLIYEENSGKHKDKGYWQGKNWIGPKPKNGIGTLPSSVPFREKGRVGYDKLNNEVIQFHRHRVDDTNCVEYWHGFVVNNQPVPMNSIVANAAKKLGYK